MDEIKRTQIQRALEAAGAIQPCPRCGNRSFSVIDGYFNQSIQDDLNEVVLGGLSIPCAVVACNKCGFLAQHALGVLKLLPTGKKNG